VFDVAWVALSLTPGIGTKTLNALLAHFGHDVDAILNADVNMLQEVRGVGPRIAHSIKTIDLEWTERAIARWQKAGVEIVTPRHIHYPLRLRDVDDAPPTLFLCGQWHHSFDNAVAIVGTRQPSIEAIQAATKLAYRLAERGYTIISGLALGIDTVAHTGALAVNGGRTLAVLGCGVLNIYPQSNRELAKRIVASHALLCEVSPQAAPNPASLVARNRIISGLSEAVIIVETDMDGGAMHAARRAHEQGRRVYAVDNDAPGNRMLLANGALAIDPDTATLDIYDC